MSTRTRETAPEMLRIDPDDDPRTLGPGAAGVRLWAALAVAAIAVAGFGGVVAYGYLAYADRGVLAPAPLVQADPKPVKVRPDDPGGMTVPHQNMGVFALGGRDGEAARRQGAEHLLPLPEAPLPKPVPQPVQPVAAAPAAPVTAEAAAQSAAAVQPAAAAAPEPLISTGPPPFPAPRPPPAAPASRLAAMQSPATTPVAAAASPSGTPTQASTPAGRFRIQVGAMRSEAEARDAWDKVRRKHGDVVGSLAATYTRVEIPGKGEFFRVHVGPLPDREAAREACARLSRGGTGCMVVPPS